MFAAYVFREPRSEGSEHLLSVNVYLRSLVQLQSGIGTFNGLVWTTGVDHEYNNRSLTTDTA